MMTPEQGLTVEELMRYVGLGLMGGSIVLLFLVEFIFRKKIARTTYYWVLLAGLFVLPMLGLTSTGVVMMEETKEVSSCNSCHMMRPFVNDLLDPQSPTLAARHYKNRWIADHQCYSCHTSYGVHGTLESKRDGFRHWLLYVTDSWKEPIRYRGTYPNANCLTCHANTPKFRQADIHQGLNADLITNKVSCVECHGPPHPDVASRTKEKNNDK